MFFCVCVAHTGYRNFILIVCVEDLPQPVLNDLTISKKVRDYHIKYLPLISVIA